MIFYLLPPKDYQSITNDDLLNMDNCMQYLDAHENFKIPSEFFEIADKNGTFFYEFLSSDLSDEKRLLLADIRTQSISESTYESIRLSEMTSEVGYVIFTESDRDSYKKDIYIYNVERKEVMDHYIPSDVIKAKRYYLIKCTNYVEYQSHALGSFPELFFLEDSFNNIRQLGRYDDVKDELTRHLSALNDAGILLYKLYHQDAYDYLKSTWNINCSGKGGNEKNTYKKKVKYNEETITLNYQPHTKFYDGYNNQRIYFCWGHEKINEAQSIIIVHIGGHIN